MVVETSRSIADVARELGLNETTLGYWVKAYRERHEGEEPELGMSERARLRELERRNRELEMESVISSGGWTVSDVADAGILRAFACVVDTLSVACLRRRVSANLLLVAIFRIKRRATVRSSATCQRRRHPGHLGHSWEGFG